MSRESCISHQSSSVYVIVRSDYRQLMDGDTVAAAILGIFEYWANAAIASNPENRKPILGAKSIRDFEEMLIGISTDKQIRKRLQTIEARGFIAIQSNRFSGKSSNYQVFISRIQDALNTLGQTTEVGSVKQPRVVNGVGQTTEVGSVKQPSTSVKQPTEPRSNDRSSYIQEDLEESNKLRKNATGVAAAIAPQNVSAKSGVTTADKKPSSGKRKSKAMPSVFPDQFNSWWIGYYDFCLEVDHSSGKRGEAAATWDEIFGNDPELLPVFLEGDDWYTRIKKQQYTATGQAIAVAHGFRYLRDGKWNEALDHKRKKAGNTPIAATPEDTAFIDYVANVSLKSRPEYRDVVVTAAAAKVWIAESIGSPKRQAAIEIYRQDFHQQRQSEPIATEQRDRELDDYIASEHKRILGAINVRT